MLHAPNTVSVLCFAAVAILTVSGTANAGENSFDQIQRGRYLVTVGDCVACHTAPNGEHMAGGQAIPTPFGEIYSANITPDEQTGIGTWEQEHFVRAMQEGINAEGEHLYPAFPYPYFTKVRREDLVAIWVYLNTLEPVDNEVEQPELYWPLGWRQLLAGWKTLFFEPGVYRPDSEKSQQWNRGAYLVEGLGHCGACHTPKNIFGSAKQEEQFSGAELQQWFAPNLTGDFKDGLGDWSKRDIVEYLKTGSNGDQIAAGLMREVIENSTQYMTRDDLGAIATYLKDLPGSSEKEMSSEENLPRREPAGSLSGEDETSRERDESEQDRFGRALYVDNCTGCHRYDGGGMQDVFPQLRGSPIVQSDNPTSLIHVVLRGAREPRTEERPNRIAMPAFDWKLTDGQVASLLSYIRGAWGNDAAPVDSDDVADIRDATRLQPAE